MNTRGLDLQRWVIVGIVGVVVPAGIWAFGVDKPARVTQARIGLRHIAEQRAELGLLETDQRGAERLVEAD